MSKINGLNNYLERFINTMTGLMICYLKTMCLKGLIEQYFSFESRVDSIECFSAVVHFTHERVVKGQKQNNL